MSLSCSMMSMRAIVVIPMRRDDRGNKWREGWTQRPFHCSSLSSLLSPYITSNKPQLQPTSTMSNQQQDYSSSTATGGRVNPNLPDSYNPVMDQRNFNAPAHNLDTQQQEQVAELAEASSGHIHAGNNIAGGHFGSGASIQLWVTSHGRRD